jgi:predicted DNA-binding transcriptional regulator YafY
MKRLERLVTMALFLGSRRRVLAREVAERFEISLRTVYRDVKALQEAGFPVEGSAGDGYRVSQAAFIRPLSLSVEEAEALTLAARSLAMMVDPAVRDALRGATTKLEASLEPHAQRRVRELARSIVVPAWAQRASGPSGEVLAALRARSVARIAYHGTRDAARTERVIEPLGLVCLGDAWWLVAYCRLREDARAFRLDRIESWEDVRETSAARPGYSFAEVIARDAHLAKSLFGS